MATRYLAHPRAMRDLSEEQNLRVVVVSIPTKEAVHARILGDEALIASTGPSGFASAVEELSRYNGFQFLDLKPVLTASSQNGLVYWADDTHWNDAGHDIAARAVVGLLAEGGEA